MQSGSTATFTGVPAVTDVAAVGVVGATGDTAKMSAMMIVVSMCGILW
jgi:hypothetical protein